MYTGFCSIRRIDEDRDGLRVTLEEGPVALLRNCHPEFKNLREIFLHILQERQTGGKSQPTWLVVDDNGVITEDRLVGNGIPLHATRDGSGQYSIVVPFTNINLKLNPRHPRFREFEGYLLAALEHETPLYFVASAEDFYSIDDMLPALPAGRPPQDGAVAAVTSGTVAAEHRE
jgi:hypothetical protein